jgi:hypothetical protein
VPTKIADASRVLYVTAPGPAPVTCGPRWLGHAGAPGIYFASGLLRGVLVGVSVWDPLTLAVVGGGLAVVALAACYIPARRVLGIQPAETLRQDA